MKKKFISKNKNWLSDKDYSFIFSRVPRTCIDLVITSSNGTLLTFRKIDPYKNKWHLPGGRVLFRERLFQAACRIAKKEIGLIVRPEKIIGTMEFLKEIKNGKKQHSISTVILASHVSGTLRGGLQAIKIKYFKNIPTNTVSVHLKFLKTLKI